MPGPADIWRQAADKYDAVINEVGDDQWELPTTCDEWTVRELVEHTMHWQAQGGAVLGADTEPGDDWADVRPAMSAALDDPANLEGNAEAMGGIPKHQVLGFVIGDLLIHSWDLARSIGADETLPPDAVEATMLGLGRVPAEMLRGPNMFGDPTDVTDGASAQDQLLAFAGRTP